jgi:hypothetical protein
VSNEAWREAGLSSLEYCVMLLVVEGKATAPARRSQATRNAKTSPAGHLFRLPTPDSSPSKCHAERKSSRIAIMPTELEEVRHQTACSLELFRKSLTCSRTRPARGVSSSWEHPDKADWCVARTSRRLPGVTETDSSRKACENLVPYSSSQPSVFKTGQLLPVRDLKLLVRDYDVGPHSDRAHWMPPAADKWPQPIAKNVLTILINLSHDTEILKNLAEDDAFLETLLSKVTVRACCCILRAVWMRLPCSRLAHPV